MYVPYGIKCPANYYCPLYPLQAVGNNPVPNPGQQCQCPSNNDQCMTPTQLEVCTPLQESASCIVGVEAVAITGNQGYAAVCPCTPGFYCPAQTEEPIYCPQGFYCPPSNATTDARQLVIDDAGPGYGAWGSLVRSKCFKCSIRLISNHKTDRTQY